ncbi:MAG: phosphoribosyltransferase [Rhizomicrobium sp.]
MRKPAKLPVLFSETEIRARVAALAREIAAMPDRPELVLPILVGGFVFAADLLRALDTCGLPLPVEFLQLRSYGQARVAQSEIRVLLGPGESVRGRHVLLIDGVLDHGHTLKTARELALAAGARLVTTAVVIDKRRPEALLQADFAAFADMGQFVVGYGMDAAGRLRSLPYVTFVE